MKEDQNLESLLLIGDLMAGRPTMGGLMHVSVYRLHCYCMRAVLEDRLGPKETDEVYYRAGKMAGQTLFLNFLNNSKGLDELFQGIKSLLERSRIGRFEVTSAHIQDREFIFALSEDLDCSGLPVDGVTKCHFDEGMFSGMLGKYFNCEFETKEVHCWATGSKKCTFRSLPKADGPKGNKKASPAEPTRK